MINRKKILGFLMTVLLLCFLCGCSKTKGSIKNNKLLGTFSNQGDSHYSYYVFDRDGNKQNTCEWKTFISQDGQGYSSTATYRYELEEIDDDSYALHLKNDNEYEAIYNVIDDTITDETGVYYKQAAYKEAEVEILLQGTWNVNIGEDFDVTFRFKNGTFSWVLEAAGIPLETKSGYYEIGKKEITIYYDSGEDRAIKYTYENDSLKLYLAENEMLKE